MNIKYKDSDVLFKKHNAYWKMNPKKCPCCNKEVQNGDAILAINNYKYFGNVLLHVECFESYEDKETLCELLEHKYTEYKILDDVFGSRTK